MKGNAIYVFIIIVLFAPLLMYQANFFAGASILEAVNQGEKILLSEEEHSSFFNKIENLEEEIEILGKRFEKREEDLSEMIAGISREISKLSLEIKESELLTFQEEVYQDKININTASKEKLTEIINIGPVLAEKIIEFRENNPFSSINDLLLVDGIGELSLKNIKEQNLVFVSDISPQQIIEEEITEEEPIIEKEDCRVDINKASKEELKKITGIGDKMAEVLIKERPFSSVYDLKRVSGIGSITLGNIIKQDCAYVEDPVSGSISRTSSRTSTLNVEEGCSENSIEINTASKEELTEIIHIGESRASDIISLRPFKSLDDLYKVSGIGSLTVEDIKDQKCAYIDESLLSQEEEIFFEVYPQSLNFEVKYGEEPQFSYISTTQDILKVDYSTSTSWILTDKEENKFSVSVDATGKEIGNYEGKIEFDYKGEKETVLVFLEVLKQPENLLENEFFEDFDSKIPNKWNWEHTENRISQSDKNPFLGDYNVSLIPIGSHNTLTQKIKGIENTTYYGEIWAKSTDKTRVRVGIRRDANNQYGDYVELKNNQWTKIKFSRESNKGEDDGIIISILESENGERPKIKIGAAWLSIHKSPEEWPNS